MSNEHFKIISFFTFQKKEPEPTQNIGSGSSSNFKSAPAPAPTKKPWLRPAPAPQHWVPVLPVLFTSICFSHMRKKNPLIFKSDSRFSRVYPLFEYFYIYYFFHFRLQFFAMFGALLIFYLFSNCFPLLYKLMMFLLFFRMWCTHWPMLPVGRVDSRWLSGGATMNDC